jgi:glutaminyl-peptide cyclotransferase
LIGFAVVIALSALVGYSAGARAAVPEFPAARAMGHLIAQCEFGPRVPQTDAHRNCLAYFEKVLRDAGAYVSTYHFRVPTDASPDSVSMANVTARFGPSGPPVILGAHWDSRPWADRDKDTARRTRPIVGANDGASGVAVLLTLAEVMRRTPPPIPVEIALFDGEDQGRAENAAGFAIGSRIYAGRLISAPRAVIVLDMVGGKGLRICREGYSEESAPWLNDILFGRARDLGLAGFEDQVCHAVVDDHYPFLERGIPAVDLVDMDYPAWHTGEDVPRSCSEESLGQTGRLLLDFLYGGSLQ